MMLKHMRLNKQATNIEQAVFKTLAEGKHLTADLGGRATNSEYTAAVIAVSFDNALDITRFDTNIFLIELETLSCVLPSNKIKSTPSSNNHFSLSLSSRHCIKEKLNKIKKAKK